MDFEAGDGAGNDAVRAGFDRLAAAEARLGPPGIDLGVSDQAVLTRFRMDLAVALLLLRACAEGGMSRRAFDQAAGALDLAPPVRVMARLPAVARIALLDLSALAETLAGALAAVRWTEGKAHEGAAESKKPRRRSARPRLSLVTPSP